MADEIQKQIIFKYVDSSGRSEGRSRGNVKTTQATVDPAVKRQPLSLTATTSDAAMTFGGMLAANQGEVLFENLSTTAGEYIIIGPDNAGAVLPMLHLYPGKQATMQLIPSVTYRFKSAAGSPKLDILVLAK